MGTVVTGLILSSCMPNETAELDARFSRNCEVIRANNAGFTGENQDYSMYADDFYMVNTNFNGSPDTMRLADLQAEDAYLWENFDFEFLESLYFFLEWIQKHKSQMLVFAIMRR